MIYPASNVALTETTILCPALLAQSKVTLQHVKTVAGQGKAFC